MKVYAESEGAGHKNKRAGLINQTARIFECAFRDLAARLKCVSPKRMAEGIGRGANVRVDGEQGMRTRALLAGTDPESAKCKCGGALPTGNITFALSPAFEEARCAKSAEAGTMRMTRRELARCLASGRRERTARL